MSNRRSGGKYHIINGERVLVERTKKLCRYQQPCAKPETAEATSDEKDQTSDSLVNLNTATAEELTTLTGIGEAGADRIITHRNEAPFESVDDLSRVGGISDAIIDKNRGLITV